MFTTIENTDFSWASKLHNALWYYEKLAEGRQVEPIFGRPVFKYTIEQRAEVVAQAIWKELQRPSDRYGVSLPSAAMSQFRFDFEQYKARKDRQLGEDAALGRAELFQEDLLALLKQVKKLSPTAKARKEANYHAKGFDPLFETITLTFTRLPKHAVSARMALEMSILEDGQPARLCLSQRIAVRSPLRDFSVSLNWQILYELCRLLDKERLTLRWHDWTQKVIIQQGRNTTRLPAMPPLSTL